MKKIKNKRHNYTPEGKVIILKRHLWKGRRCPLDSLLAVFTFILLMAMFTPVVTTPKRRGISPLESRDLCRHNINRTFSVFPIQLFVALLVLTLYVKKKL